MSSRSRASSSSSGCSEAATAASPVLDSVQDNDDYCAVCGQKELSDHDWAIGHFVHELTHELLHVDSNIFRTLKLLLFRPGELTARYLAGHRLAFISPIRLYLVVTAVFFFFGATADFTVEGLTRVGVLKGAVEGLQQAAQSKGQPYEVIVGEFNHLFHKSFSILIALAVLVFNTHAPKANVTWADIEPWLEQYALLFPAMKEPSVNLDLGDQNEVDRSAFAYSRSS